MFTLAFHVAKFRHLMGTQRSCLRFSSTSSLAITLWKSEGEVTWLMPQKSLFSQCFCGTFPGRGGSTLRA